MIFAIRARRLAVTFAAVALFAFAQTANAQEISESHLKAARAAVDAINATDYYDGILPSAAQALKTELIQKNPDLEPLIIKTVDDQAIKLASRRTDLERESALAYARVFTEKQLNDIATFYRSETGLKLLSDGPIVTRELTKAAQIWQNGIARDLAQAVGQSLVKEAPSAPAVQMPGQDQGMAPQGGATPPALEGGVPGMTPAPEGGSN
jgi:hypothetical protein